MDELETKHTRCRGITTKRVSHFINRKPAAHLFHAVNIAEELGRPLNQFVTINFAKTDCPEELVSERFERLRDNHFGPWLRRCGKGGSKAAPPTFIWVIENTGGCMNAHWLVHIPAGRLDDFKARLPQWLQKVAGEVQCETALHLRPAKTPKGAVKYMNKGIDPMYAELYRIEHSDQGKVIGNRSNFSRCLGPSTRRRLQSEGRMRPTRRIGLPRRAPEAASRL